MITPYAFLARMRRGVLARAAAVTLGTALAACGGDTTAPAPLAHDAAHGFWRLGLNHKAVLMSTAAPYDTLQLVATPLNLAGEPLSGSDTAGVVTTYEIADPTDTNVVVSSAGLVQARHPDYGVLIRVRTTVRGVTQMDSLQLTVTDVANPPTFARLALTLTPSDTAYLNDFWRPIPVLTAQALDPDGHVIDSVTFALSSSDTTVAQPDAFGLVGPQYPGHATLSATATVYGVRRTVSLPITVTWPLLAEVVIRAQVPHGSVTPVVHVDPLVITVAAGATVMWNYSVNTEDVPDPPAVGIVFDEPGGAHEATGGLAPICAPGGTGDGNIPAYKPDGTFCGARRFRAFPDTGTFHFHDTSGGNHGVIVVVPP